NATTLTPRSARCARPLSLRWISPRKVVGVGSVGTDAMMILLMGDLEDDPLFLQIKEANTSVLAPYAGESECAHQGERVVHGQRLMQAASDAFLGWLTGTGEHRRE